LTGELPPRLAGTVAHSTSTAALLVRVVVAFALTYVLGYERELRGSPAGDRTFSLIGTASAVLGNLAGVGSPNAIAGAVTGIGFIGGGIVVRRAVRTGEIISGITTAASIFATAAIGAAAGAGLLAVAALATGLVLVALEGPHLPLLRLVDARRWSPRFHNDEELYRDDDTAVLPDTTPPADRDQRTSPASDDVGPASAAYHRPG
jgi:putative Mg2+ transporter-C (MgtC) family protein